MNASKRYPLTKNGVFSTLQGEGHLRGKRHTFIRLAGCSVGCDGCDTDYRGVAVASTAEIAERADAVTPSTLRDRWAWITGGEPTDHELAPLIAELRASRFSIAVATSGHRRFIPPVDWLSVSPHDPSKWVQLFGHEVKLVPGLNGFGLDDFIAAHPDSETDFFERYVSPLSRRNAAGDFEEDPDSLRECLAWLVEHPNWSLSRQDHHAWRIS